MLKFLLFIQCQLNKIIEKLIACRSCSCVICHNERMAEREWQDWNRVQGA